MSTSSIHFQRADVEFAEKHNSRETGNRQPSYLLPKDRRQSNDFEKLADAHKLHEDQMKKRRDNKIPGRAPTLQDSYWEAVVNLNSEHTIEDVRKVAEHIRQNYKLTPTSLAIHRDEGYIDQETGETKYNYHAHLTFYTIADCRSQMRLMTRAKLRDLQTEVAQLLGMKRGQEHSQAKRLDHQQYRAVKRAEEKKLNALKSDIRKQMISEGGFTAQDYRDLNKLITDYKTAFKLGESVTVSDVIKDIYQRLSITAPKLSQCDEITPERVEVQQDVQQPLQSQPMSVLEEQKTTEEKIYKIDLGNGENSMTAQAIRDWLTDYPEERDIIAKQLTEEDRAEVFGKPTQTTSLLRSTTGFHR